jgi:hypothetical protein
MTARESSFPPHALIFNYKAGVFLPQAQHHVLGVDERRRLSSRDDDDASDRAD